MLMHLLLMPFQEQVFSLQVFELVFELVSEQVSEQVFEQLPTLHQLEKHLFLHISHCLYMHLF